MLFGLLVMTSGCRRGEESAAYQACYERCVHPPAGECHPGHDWCIQVCRPGQNVGPRVVAAVLSDAPANVGPFPLLLAHSIGLETLGGVFTPLIKQCTQLPAEYSEVFSTAADNQSQVQIAILSGEAPRVKDNAPLGLFFLKEIPSAPRAVPQIRVTFRIEANGLLAVTAKDLATGKSQAVGVGRR